MTTESTLNFSYFPADGLVNRRYLWVANLDKIAARHPEKVIPGHMDLDSPTGLEAIEFTKTYLLAFDEELDKASSSAELKAAMEARYPNLGLGVALDIGSKVNTGEMKWG